MGYDVVCSLVDLYDTWILLLLLLLLLSLLLLLLLLLFPEAGWLVGRACTSIIS